MGRDDRIEIIELFDQYCFRSWEAGEQLTLMRSVCQLWESQQEFAQASQDCLWAKWIYRDIERDYLPGFLEEATISLKEQYSFVPSIGKEAGDFVLISDQWNSRAIAWREIDYYFAVWKTISA